MKKRNVCLLFCLICAMLMLYTACTDSEEIEGTYLRTEQNDRLKLNDSASLVSGEYTLSPAYKEAWTYYNNTVTNKSMRFTVSYESTFYGHDSAINRDLSMYGDNFEYLDGVALTERTSYFSADINGDRQEEILFLKYGKLCILEAQYESHYGEDIVAQYEIGTGVLLRGVGDFNGDGRYDLLLTGDGGSFYIYEHTDANTFVKHTFASDIDINSNTVHAGDVDGDGLCDIVLIKGTSVVVWRNESASMDSFGKMPPQTFYIQEEYDSEYSCITVGDLNTDSFTDIVLATKQGENSYIVTLFGRGDGRFGPDESELSSDVRFNLRSSFTYTKAVPNALFLGDMDADGRPDLCAISHNDNNSRSTLRIWSSTDHAAYDYSLDGILLEDGSYLMYSGCRWRDYTHQDITEVCDGDHVMMSYSADGINWKRRLEAPAFYLGWEINSGPGWWTQNTLEPEVIIVDGVYHMFWQVNHVTPSGNYGDCIGYASSTDGINWTRKTDSPVIVNVQNDEIGFNHEEVIYVADDPDGKVWWMYTGHFVSGVFKGYVRIRSESPTSFDWADRESTRGMAQIGNQIGYVNDVNGSRLFMRITFIEAGSGTVPAFNISRNGLNWIVCDDFILATVDKEDPFTANNRNVYFLGMTTLNGTGEIPQKEDGSYELIYLATTCASSIAPQIFAAEAGCGKLVFRFE